eukprot:11741918-Alexandrium_andersonii.AAC.1
MTATASQRVGCYVSVWRGFLPGAFRGEAAGPRGLRGPPGQRECRLRHALEAPFGGPGGGSPLPRRSR